MSFSITIDAEEVLRDLSRLPDKIDEEIESALESLMPRIEQYAQRNHRFNSRTGTLVSSIRSEVKSLLADLYIDDSVADYGVYVHEGHGSWRPDKFLDGAIRAFDREINTTIEKAAERAIRESGL
jgi:predicted component of type VI protein secretion system